MGFVISQRHGEDSEWERRDWQFSCRLNLKGKIKNFQRYLLVFIGCCAQGERRCLDFKVNASSLQNKWVFGTNIYVSKPSGGLRSLTSACLALRPAPDHACNTVCKEKTKQGTALRHDRNVFPLEGAPKKSSERQNENKCWGKVVS